MAYTQTTLAQATSQLAVSLRDPQSSYWSLQEKYDAIKEALRMFQALTGSYRQRATFATSTGVAFYDLRTVIPNEYAFTITDDDLLSEIQAHFLEPISNPWVGSDQFSITSILSAMQNVRDNYLLDSGVYITRSTPSSSPPPVGRVQLDETIIDIRRCSWMDSSTSLSYGISRSDEYAGQAYTPGWPQAPSLPYQYSVALTPPISLQLIPAPSNSGQLDLCTTNSGPDLALDPASPVVLGVPNDLCWGLKWGTMSQLLTSDGDVRDPQRAKYCQDMYGLAVSLGRNPVTTLQVQVNDLLLSTTSIDDLDRYFTSWQNNSGRPSMAAMVGANLLVLCGDSNSGTGIPDSAGYGVTLDLATSFPVPTSPSAFIQVGAELLNAILDMAQHICSFKMTGQEFMDTIELRNNFLRTCALINARLRSNAFYNLLLNQPATRQDYQVPRTAPRAPEEVLQ